MVTSIRYFFWRRFGIAQVSSYGGKVGLKPYLAGRVGQKPQLSGEVGLKEYNRGDTGLRG